MIREMLQAKLHRAVVTDTKLEYAGSLTIDTDLLDAVGIRIYQKVQVVNVNNGSRLETYVIPGEAGKGEIIVNGAAARLAQKGDLLIIIAYGQYTDEELEDYKPKVAIIGESNELVEIL